MGPDEKSDELSNEHAGVAAVYKPRAGVLPYDADNGFYFRSDATASKKNPDQFPLIIGDRERLPPGPRLTECWWRYLTISFWIRLQ
jgi:hypothetical protein